MKIDNPAGYTKTPHLFSVDHTEIIIDTDTIFEDVMVIKLIKIVNPDINYEQGKDSDNIRTLQKNIEQSIEKAKQAAGIEDGEVVENVESSEQKFIIEKFILSGASVNAYVKLLGNDVNTLTLPDIVLTDLGKKSKGASAAELAKQLFDTLIKKIQSAFLSNKLGDLFNFGNLSDLKDKAAAQLKSLTEGLKDKIDLDAAKDKINSLKDQLSDTLGDSELLDGTSEKVDKGIKKAEKFLKDLKF